MHIFNSHLLIARVTRNASIRPQNQLTSPVFSLRNFTSDSHQQQQTPSSMLPKHFA
jgi:hypothetical protein